MITWGISANSHDAAVAIFHDKKLVYAGHSERYARKKNHGDLDQGMVQELIKQWGYPDKIHWYENPYLKTLRQWQAGQGFLLRENNIKRYLKHYGLTSPTTYQRHHHSHAAAGYYTSKFRDAAVVVIDSIGEFETLTIWHGKESKLTKVYSQGYPHSIGLWYSAMTQRCGLKPNEEEYILMGMSALGDPERLHAAMLEDFFSNARSKTLISFNQNLHRGCKDWRPDLISQQDIYDIAAATQAIYEMLLVETLVHAQALTGSRNLVLMGGCALNCVANVFAHRYFKDVWIMPNPGDAGSAVGAVLAAWGHHVKWPGAYLGHDMGSQGNNERIVDQLLDQGMAAVARGRAEYGPRALGNRSLLGDPRLADIKDRMNRVKRREPFRPFAPAILAEHADKYFEMPTKLTPYMQYAVRCRHPEQFPGIVHVDGTSRVQTVTKRDNPEFRALLELWYEKTGCPMLVNTSLNIKGEPLINTHADADRWESKYGITIFR